MGRYRCSQIPPWPSGQSSGSAFSRSSTRAACRRVRSTGSCSSSRFFGETKPRRPVRLDTVPNQHLPARGLAAPHLEHVDALNLRPRRRRSARTGSIHTVLSVLRCGGRTGSRAGEPPLSRSRAWRIGGHRGRDRLLPTRTAAARGPPRHIHALNACISRPPRPARQRKDTGCPRSLARSAIPPTECRKCA